MYCGQMFPVVFGFDGCTAAVKRAFPVVGGQVEDDVFCRGKFKYLTRDSLEVIEEGAPIGG